MNVPMTTCAVALLAAIIAVPDAHAQGPAEAKTAGMGEATAEMKGRDGSSLGTVTLKSTPNGALVHARLQDMPKGTHAFHVHAVGTCEGDFTSAGGHFNPTDADHGFQSAKGPHAGDFANIHVPASGKLEFEKFSTILKLDNQLFDEDGAAIVVHRGADDYQTEPAGDAGSRIACGVIRR